MFVNPRFATASSNVLSIKGSRFFELTAEDMKRCKQLVFPAEIFVDKNKNVYSTGSHHDIPATLMHQLGLNAGMFNWSNDLLNRKRHGFAYLCMDDAEGWITDSCTFVYDLSNKKFIYKSD